MVREEDQLLTVSKDVLQFGLGKQVSYNKQAIVSNIVEQQVVIVPDNIAVKFNRKKLTYRQLNEQANQLARYIINKGMQPNAKIAVYLEPSLELVVSILAILKAGGCYVPLDINYPADRLNFMLADSASTILLTQSVLIHKLQEVETIQVIQTDKDSLQIKKEAAYNLDNLTTADKPAYIIYTSGSTGRPKGVAIHHQAINNHMTWMINEFAFDSSDVILLKTPLSFDPSVWEFFIPLCIGGQLVVSPAGAYLDPAALVKLINKHRVTTIQFVPSLFNEFLKQKNISSCQSLRRIFSGGETLRPETKKLFFDKLNCQLHNLYGPTEATIEVAFHTIKPISIDIESNIVGKPIYNTQLYVLDSEMNLIDINEEGELYIGGDSLAKGYHNNLAETQQNFVDNPFSDGNKLYKTGDVVKWSEDGDLIYVGRNNDQIKINGVRVEPQEIISHILASYPIANCAITKKIDADNHPYLACYLVSQDDCEVNVLAIKNSLKKFFPIHIVPKAYAVVQALPLTINGKLDFSALANFDATIQETSHIQEEPSPQEEKLINVWKKILKKDLVFLQDNFFDIGGHSILAFQVLLEVKAAFRIELQIKDIFLYPTVAGLAERINELEKIKSRKKNKTVSMNSIISLQAEGNGTPLFLIHPIGGTVFWYSLLAKELGKRRPIYAIQDPAIDLGKIIFNNISEMAEFYLKLIQKVQPQGPYLIGGASFGATVAIEIARNLLHKNEKVDLVPIFDGWAVYPTTLLDDNYFKSSMQKQHEDIKKKFSQHNLPDSKKLFDIQWQRLSLLWQYQLQEIKCPIALFKSRDLLPAFQEIDEPLNHWSKFTNKPIKSYLVPGNHETMFQLPHVRQLAINLNQCIDEYSS